MKAFSRNLFCPFSLDECRSRERLPAIPRSVFVISWKRSGLFLSAFAFDGFGRPFAQAQNELRYFVGGILAE